MRRVETILNFVKSKSSWSGRWEAAEEYRVAFNDQWTGEECQAGDVDVPAACA